MGGRGRHPVRVHPHDRRLAQVDQRHIVAVERLEVVVVGADSLRSDRMVGRDQPVGDLWIVDDCANLLLPEGAGGVVGCHVEHLVGKGLAEQHAAQLPTRFVRFSAFLLGHVERRQWMRLMR
jgi:hypothetical protein